MKKPACQYIDTVPADAATHPDFPSYRITPRGEVISLLGRPKLKRQSLNRVGYPICGMRSASGEMRWPLVHRLVAFLFVDGDKTLTVNHIDMDKRNNNASNLEWVTHSENHRKGRALKPEWAAKTGSAVSRAVIAKDILSGAETYHVSGRAAALWVGRLNAAGNISKAIRSGAAAYGYHWCKARH